MEATVEQLLAETDWLRALARSLVGEPAEADDLVQETLIAALQHPPDGARPLRPWLRRVLRNTAFMRFRSARRRAVHQAQLPIPEAPTTPSQLLQQVQTQRLLADLVVELAEPYRSTLLLRYVQGLSAAEIARQEQIPAGTVRWRLKQALDQLRSALDQRNDGDSQRWHLSLAPLAGLKLTGGVLAVKTTVPLLAAAVLALLIATGVLLYPRGHERPSQPSQVSPAAAATDQGTVPTPHSQQLGDDAAPAAAKQIVPPTPPPPVRRMTASTRQRLTRDIRNARKRRLASPPAEPSGLAPATGHLERNYVRQQVRTMVPLIKECYELGLAQDPTLAGTIVVEFRITGEPEIGGFVEQVSIDGERSSLRDELVNECVRETMYATEFNAPDEGASVVVRYPFTFRSAADLPPAAAAAHEQGDPTSVIPTLKAAP